MSNPKNAGSRSPHRRVAAAVLANAVQELGEATGRRRVTPGERLRARDWLLSKRAEGWMDLLGFEPAAIREGLRRKGLLP